VRNINKYILLVIPLILSSFTHLWNASQFPSFHPDEGVYLRRALHTLVGLGPQDPSSRYDHAQDSNSSYDHPFFGQIFLASIFKIIDYPEFLNTTPDLKSIDKLFTIPRLIMGALAVIDTFLIYRIGERRFNPTVGLFAALLFAVMPLSWFTRRIVLDSIMLPFALGSILLALEIRSNAKYAQILSILSGICLGLAIFTKIPSFTLIPLIIYLIYPSINKKTTPPKSQLKIMTLFLFPVILIPTIWPLYAFVTGDLSQWVDGLSWQTTERFAEGKSLFDIGDTFLKTDPVLFIFGIASIAYLTIRREYIAIAWIAPYIALLYLVGWVTHFHLILIIPILCISIAKMMYDLPFIVGLKRKNLLISSAIISAIVLFGFISTTILISTNLTYVQFETISYISNEIMSKYSDSNIRTNNTSIDQNPRITVITGPIFSWVFKYVFHNNYTFSHVRDTQPIKTEKMILLVDTNYKNVISNIEQENQTQIERLRYIYNNTDVVALLSELPAHYVKKNYPFTAIDSAHVGFRNIEIRANY
jgi:Dolichyl-phosphate-mannose-protein mannosyltransferase